MTPEEAIRAAHQAGLDGMIFSEHDLLWSGKDLDLLRKEFTEEFLVFAGMEVSCEEGHFIVIGLTGNEGVSYGMPAEELIELSHESGAIVIAAHPYRYSLDQGDLCYGLEIDGVEVDSSNTTSEAALLAKTLAESKGVIKIQSSDSHSVKTLGSYFTEFPETISTAGEIADFIRKRNMSLKADG